MNTYEIRITNVDDHSEFTTHEVMASELQVLNLNVKHAVESKGDGVQFQHGDRYIVIEEASDEGYMYDIYTSKKNYELECESIDGGQCIGTLADAIEMAIN